MNSRNAGRPKEKNPKDVQLTIRFTSDENKQIEELAEKIGMSKTKLMRNIILGNIDDVNFLQNIGSLPLIQKYKKFITSL